MRRLRVSIAPNRTSTWCAWRGECNDPAHSFCYVNTPIVTASDCEGAGEQFQVTTLLNGIDGPAAATAAPAAAAAKAPAASPEDIAAAKAAAAEQGATVKALKEAKKAGDATKEDVDAAVATLLSLKAAAEELENPAAGPAAAASSREVPRAKDGAVDYTQDFFGKPSYLTVSGQLNAEIYACAMRDVYTFGPTFRAENSNTSRHLAEFWMVEPELAFADLQAGLDIKFPGLLTPRAPPSVVSLSDWVRLSHVERIVQHVNEARGWSLCGFKRSNFFKGAVFSFTFFCKRDAEHAK